MAKDDGVAWVSLDRPALRSWRLPVIGSGGPSKVNRQAPARKRL
jgi:hypothetical protein